MFDRLFLQHPRSVGETYFEHAAMALGFAARLFLAGLACMIHALVPGVLQRTGSRMIADLQARIVTGRRRMPAAVELDYAI
ncbi:MAG: hypothetical protein KBA31_16035 [Alphaproteobacteria bacterium]|nr:hypothetical protein [Alphaproteobacteria bacterium]